MYSYIYIYVFMYYVYFVIVKNVKYEYFTSIGVFVIL